LEQCPLLITGRLRDRFKPGQDFFEKCFHKGGIQAAIGKGTVFSPFPCCIGAADLAMGRTQKSVPFLI
jgi:hypothetical protein